MFNQGSKANSQPMLASEPWLNLIYWLRFPTSLSLSIQGESISPPSPKIIVAFIALLSWLKSLSTLLVLLLHLMPIFSLHSSNFWQELQHTNPQVHSRLQPLTTQYKD